MYVQYLSNHICYVLKKKITFRSIKRIEPNYNRLFLGPILYNVYLQNTSSKPILIAHLKSASLYILGVMGLVINKTTNGHDLQAVNGKGGGQKLTLHLHI